MEKKLCFPHRGSAIGVVPNRIGRPHVTLVSKDLTKDLNIRHKPNEEPIGFFCFFECFSCIVCFFCRYMCWCVLFVESFRILK